MLIRVGVLLIVLSFLAWLLILAVPFVLSGGAAVATGVGLAIGAEVIFWLGLILAGRDTWRLVKEHGWRGVPAAMWHTLRHGQPPARPASSASAP
ncbi:MAG: hypothetical protein H0W01_05580 [Pseudonocardiales bacterium]|nr:hypothetical protein [Pseudonocardiales bacterium]